MSDPEYQPAAQPQVTIEVCFKKRCVTYPVYGRDTWSLARDLRGKRTRRRWAALTKFHVKWKATYGAINSTHCIQSLTLTVLLEKTYPKLASKRPLSKNPLRRMEWYRMLKRWKRTLGALRRHENYHEKICMEALDKMQQRVRSLPPRATLGEMQSALDAACGDVIRRCRQKHDRFDEATDHGRNEGCTYGGLF